MAVCFWYLVKSVLSSVHRYRSLYWISNFLQGTRKTRPCLIGHPVYNLDQKGKRVSWPYNRRKSCRVSKENFFLRPPFTKQIFFSRNCNIQSKMMNIEAKISRKKKYYKVYWEKKYGTVNGNPSIKGLNKNRDFF